MAGEKGKTMAKKPVGSPLLPLSILAILLACGFTVVDGNVSWYWGQSPWVAGLLVVAGLSLGGWHVAQRSRRIRS